MMADVVRVDDRWVFDRLHVAGEGLTIGSIRTVAKFFGQVEDVVEVMIQGGDREIDPPAPVGAAARVRSE